MRKNINVEMCPKCTEGYNRPNDWALCSNCNSELEYWWEKGYSVYIPSLNLHIERVNDWLEI